MTSSGRNFRISSTKSSRKRSSDESIPSGNPKNLGSFAPMIVAAARVSSSLSPASCCAVTVGSFVPLLPEVVTRMSIVQPLELIMATVPPHVNSRSSGCAKIHKALLPDFSSTSSSKSLSGSSASMSHLKIRYNLDKSSAIKSQEYSIAR